MSRLRRLAYYFYENKAFLHCAMLCLIGVLLLSPAFAEQTRSQGPSPVQQRVQPLDPLTPDEVALAAQVVSSDPRVKEALGRGRQQLIHVEFLALKTATYRETTEPEQLRIGRHAAVIYYRYDTDQGIHVVVDLERKSIVEITLLEGKTVPLAAAEVTEAVNLALRNERVRALLGSMADEFKVAGIATRERAENRVEGLRLVATSSEDPCYRHRCLDLIFRRREGYIAGTSVTVDLTAQTVRVERSAK
jgi:hypothetical protein